MPEEKNIKRITCPIHQDQPHKAVLYTFGHEYGGMWECGLDGDSDSCEHESTHVEIATSDRLGMAGHYQTEHKVYVCDACEMTVDGSPEADEADARADMEFDTMRDNQINERGA